MGLDESGSQSSDGAHGAGEHTKRLTALLCWAIVFADIGTSIYYVPGILYVQFGTLAGLFVFMTMIAFLLLTLKYAEVSVRFPEGGGVVTVASRALNPWMGAVGGMFILVDYFLTSAISSVSGVTYFTTVMPQLTPWILPITLFLITALGVLNWWGIKESAVVSLVIAITAFVSDCVILLLVILRVPPTTMLQIFQEMFAGHTLGGLTLLLGFAGAFLAFSGLESISQLSPVMRLPRSKTVTRALAFVVITVGVTSPLLTLFATVLLTDPKYTAHVTYPIRPAAVNPDQFISLLAGAYGGQILEVATAVTAAALLVFASNTAIIGAYHVFLALSRLRFFPEIVEKQNKLRGTPHVSIALATVIPMIVLVAVRGNINTLGDLYAFGLLGAFSLTCVSMDVIRWREHHGEDHIGAKVDPELIGLDGQPKAPPPDPPSAIDRLARQALDRTLSAETRAQITGVGRRLALVARPVTRRLRVWWPTITYVLGFFTTLLVGVAWAVNLFGKPLATYFGGGLTLFGLAISVVHFRYQSARYPIVFLEQRVVPAPGSHLVILSPIDGHNKQVIEAAIQSAIQHTLVFLYLAPQQPQQRLPRLFEIEDRFGTDKMAQRTLSRAKRRCNQTGIPCKFLYAIGGAQQVFDIASRLRPDEIIAEKPTAARISKGAPTEFGMAVSPDYVRYQIVDGVRVAHNVLHEVYSRGANTSGSRAAPPTTGTTYGPFQPRSRPAAPTPDAPSSASALPNSNLRPRNITGIGHPQPEQSASGEGQGRKTPGE